MFKKRGFFVLILGISLLLVALILFLIFPSVDVFINSFFSKSSALGFTSVMKFISFITDPVFIIFLSGVLLVYFLVKKNFQNFFILFAGVGGGALLEIGLKELLQRARPENALLNETSFSFPSGHAMISVIFFGILIYLFYDEIESHFLKSVFVVVCCLTIFIISFSRIYLNVHWFSDVVGGLGLGILWIWLALLLEKFLSTSNTS